MSTTETTTSTEETAKEFDVDRWLAGATLPARSVQICRNAGLRAEYDRLERRFLELQAVFSREEVEHPQGDPNATSRTLDDLYAVALQMQDLLPRMHADPLQVKVRACTADELEKIRKEFPDAEQEELRLLECVKVGGTIAGASLPRKRWRALRNAVGERQFSDIVRAAIDVNGFGVDTSIVPELPPAMAALLATSKD